MKLFVSYQSEHKNNVIKLKELWSEKHELLIDEIEFGNYRDTSVNSEKAKKLLLKIDDLIKNSQGVIVVAKKITPFITYEMAIAKERGKLFTAILPLEKGIKDFFSSENQLLLGLFKTTSNVSYHIVFESTTMHRLEYFLEKGVFNASHAAVMHSSTYNEMWK